MARAVWKRRRRSKPDRTNRKERGLRKGARFIPAPCEIRSDPLALALFSLCKVTVAIPLNSASKADISGHPATLPHGLAEDIFTCSFINLSVFLQSIYRLAQPLHL